MRGKHDDEVPGNKVLLAVSRTFNGCAQCSMIFPGKLLYAVAKKRRSRSSAANSDMDVINNQLSLHAPEGTYKDQWDKEDRIWYHVPNFGRKFFDALRKYYSIQDDGREYRVVIKRPDRDSVCTWIGIVGHPRTYATGGKRVRGSDERESCYSHAARHYPTTSLRSQHQTKRSSSSIPPSSLSSFSLSSSCSPSLAAFSQSTFSSASSSSSASLNETPQLSCNSSASSSILKLLNNLTSENSCENVSSKSVAVTGEKTDEGSWGGSFSIRKRPRIEIYCPDSEICNGERCVPNGIDQPFEQDIDPRKTDEDEFCPPTELDSPMTREYMRNTNAHLKIKTFDNWASVFSLVPPSPSSPSFISSSSVGRNNNININHTNNSQGRNLLKNSSEQFHLDPTNIFLPESWGN